MKSIIFVVLAILGLTLTMASCSPSAPVIPKIDASKEPLKAYAAEMKYQYDLILTGYHKGTLSEKDIDAYLASWDRVIKYYPQVTDAYSQLTDQQKSAYAETDFKYSWISGGKILDDGTVDQTGFYGAALDKKTGNIYNDYTPNSLAGLAVSPGQVLLLSSDNCYNLLIDITDPILADLDKVVPPKRKSKLVQQIVDKIIACYHFKDVNLSGLKGAGSIRFLKNSPYLNAWLGF